MPRFLLAAFAIGLAVSVPAQEPTTTKQITVPMSDGAVRVDELVNSLATAYELDITGLALPATTIDLGGPAGAAMLFAAKKVLLDTVRFRRRATEHQLVVTIDRERARDVRRDLRSRLAKLVGTLTGADVTARRYDLALPEAIDRTRPLVVLVHGVESSPESMHDLRAFLTAAPRGCQVATFAYPDDESIDTIAAAFARELRSLDDQPVAIVAHSMGGLVARAVVENPELDPKNVRTLVMLGTPNHGSDVAALRCIVEVGEAMRDGGASTTSAEALLVALLAERLRDGLGQAGGDLLPGSVFLQQLGARSRNPDVRYHVVLGTRSLLSEERLATSRAQLLQQISRSAVARVAQPRLDRWLADLDELVDGKGDGAVGVVSGSLEGVEPALVPLDHCGLVRLRGFTGAGDAAEHPVFARVAEWVTARDQRGVAPSRETVPSQR